MPLPAKCNVPTASRPGSPCSPGPSWPARFPNNPLHKVPTNNQQPTTNNQQPTTNNQQPTTNNQQPTTNNQQPTTNNQQQNPKLFKTEINDLTIHQIPQNPNAIAAITNLCQLRFPLTEVLLFMTIKVVAHPRVD